MTRIPVERITRRRRSWLVTRACLLMAALFVASGCSETETPQGPDVVLVVVDTLRADRLGTYGYPLNTSPNLDALAGEGLVFERAIAASTATAPSHASMMTSRWVRDHSIGYMNGSTQLEGDKTLAEVFREAGYDTAAFIGNAVIRTGIGIDRGFDVYDDELPSRERNRPIFERTAPATTERAIKWLKQPRDRPYFLWVHYQDPHGPYTPPAPWDEDLQAPSLEGVDRPLRKLSDQSGRGGLPAYQWIKGDRASKRYRSRYAGEIRHFDDWLGNLIKAVEAKSEGREIIWAITSDHGESLGEDDFWFAHGHATTPDLSHIPFIVRAPGLAAGRVKGLAHHVDLLPTLLALAGLPVPANARGIDLTAKANGGALPDRVVFSDIGGEASAYSRDGFVRVVDPRTVAQAGAGKWSHHRWSREGVLLPGAGDLGVGWELDPTKEAVSPEAKKALEEYLSLVPPMKATAAPDEEQIERLRALGYIDPAG